MCVIRNTKSSKQSVSWNTLIGLFGEPLFALEQIVQDTAQQAYGSRPNCVNLDPDSITPVILFIWELNKIV